MLQARKILALLTVAALIAGCTPQNENIKENQGQAVITQQHIDVELVSGDRAHGTVVELTDEKYNGRLAGTTENLKAAEYIAAEFEAIGLESPKGIEGYFQHFEQKNVIMNSGSKYEFLSVSGESEIALVPNVDIRDMVRFPATLASGSRIGEMVHITDLNQFDKHPEALAGKILLINHEVYDPHNPMRVIGKALSLSPKAGGIFIHRDNRYNQYYLVSKYLPNEMMQSEFDNENGPGVFYVTAEGFTKCIDAIRDGKLMQYSIDYNYDTFEVPNVVGYLPASIEEPRGTIMFSAHFDHVGTNGDGSYNPGGLDNASGVAAIIELARVITSSEEERTHNFAFIAFNGEEESLLGAKHYVEHPLFPLDETTLINFDMVGSTRERPLNIDVSNFAMGDTQDQLYELAQELGIPARKDFNGGSDHAPFEAKGVDSVLLINLDMTDIHTRLDTAENVDPENLESILELVVSWINEYKTD